MRNVYSCSLVVAAILSIAGCAVDSAEGPMAMPEGQPASVALQSLDKGDGQAGQDPGDVTTAADCVYVQWCNEPGPNGTICRLRSGCTVNSTTVNECIADTYAVCGAPVNPWYIY